MRIRWKHLRTVLPLAASALAGSAYAQSGPRPSACAAHAPEAAVRSGVTIDIILRVMRAESAGQPLVRSPKGAMGCMQIMPATWDTLAPRYGLGADPFDARMNMIGGAMYLAELQRRFGLPGAFAAYSAGPARYLGFAEHGVPLPAETVAYVNRIGVGPERTIIAATPVRWQEAGLFSANTRHAPADDIGSARQADGMQVGTANVGEPSLAASPLRPVASLFPLLSNPQTGQR